MPKYSYEQKLSAVLDVVEKGLSTNAVGKAIGASHSGVRQWVMLYREHGIAGLKPSYKTYDGQFKADVVEYMYANHLSARATAAKFGVPSYASIGIWERIYCEEGRDALFRDNRGRKKMPSKIKPKQPKRPPKIEGDLAAENERLRMEVAYLKKLNALVQERVQRENGKK